VQDRSRTAATINLTGVDSCGAVAGGGSWIDLGVRHFGRDDAVNRCSVMAWYRALVQIMCWFIKIFSSVFLGEIVELEKRGVIYREDEWEKNESL